MQKLRDYLICILSSLLLVYLQKDFIVNFPLLEPSSFYYGNYLFLSLILGLSFGFISCPVCGFPLSLSLASTEKRLLNIFQKNIVFHLGRFLIIFFYAFVGGLIVQALNRFFYNLSFLLGGILMLVMGIGLLFKIKVRLPFLFLKKGGVNPLFYFIFGLSLGFACSLEAVGFLVPLWAKDSISYFMRVVAGFIFSLSAVLPTLFMSFLVYLGFKGVIFLFKERVRFFLVNSSGFFLLFLGLLFITSFFRR